MKRVVKRAGVLLAVTLFSLFLFTSCGGDDEILDELSTEIETEGSATKKE